MAEPDVLMQEVGPILAEDEAIKRKLTGLKLQDTRTNTRDVPVRFINPSTDIADAAKLPYFSIEQHSITYDASRDHVGKIEVGHWPSTEILNPLAGPHYTEFPLPVRIFYHIVGHATSPQHLAMMTRFLLLPQKFPLKNGWLFIPATETWTVMHVMGYQRDSLVRQNRAIHRITVPVHVEASLLKTQIAAAEPVETVDLTVEERTDNS